MIEKGATMLGISLDELINDCMYGYAEVAEEIGLTGISSQERSHPPVSV